MNTSSISSSILESELSSARGKGGSSDRYSVSSSGSRKSFQPMNSSMQSLKKNVKALPKQHTTQKDIEIIDPLTGEKRNVQPLSNINPKVAKQRGRGGGEGSTVSGQVSPSSRSDNSLSQQSFSYIGSESISRAESSSVYSDSSNPSLHSEVDDFSFSGQPMSLDDTRSVGSGDHDGSFSDIGVSDLRDDDEDYGIDGDLPDGKKDRADFEQQDEYGGLGRDVYEELMEREYTITLNETQTIFLFENYDRAVATTSDFLKSVQERNARYMELKKHKQENPDRYTSNFSQTLNKFFKNKYTNTESKELEEAEVNATDYEIYDEYQRMQEEEEREREEREQISNAVQTEDDDEESEDAIANMGMEDEEEHMSIHGKPGAEEEKIRSIFKKTHFKDDLMTVERMVVHNQFKESQEEYKRVEKVNLSRTTKQLQEPKPDTTSTRRRSKSRMANTPSEAQSQADAANEEDNSLPIGSLKTLWTYNCPVVQGVSVNCMAWNHVNKDILAAGYSNLSLTDTKESIIMCWTVKNPMFPERVIKVPNLGITSIDFSKSHPSLLSIGCSDGTVCIYDVRKRDNEPVLESSMKHHTGTVWGMQWVEQGKDVGERLRSVGVDGRVNAWAIKKGLECQEIMRLKRTSKQSDLNTSTSGADAAIILRESGGMSIDTDPSEPNFYVVGTEDGPIHKCSGSYNEQYLETYYGHTGPVYRVRYDPFDVSRFASCSADWTIRLWDQETSGTNGSIKTIEVFRAASEPSAKKQSFAVTDIAWSKCVPSLIASTTITGRIDLWDVSNAGSTVKPRFRASREGVVHNCIMFANNSHALLAGDSAGNIEVLKPAFEE